MHLALLAARAGEGGGSMEEYYRAKWMESDEALLERVGGWACVWVGGWGQSSAAALHRLLIWPRRCGNQGVCTTSGCRGVHPGPPNHLGIVFSGQVLPGLAETVAVQPQKPWLHVAVAS